MLGCFHTFMNVLGAIGTLMAGMGLKRILEEIYGENALVHMMTGKSVQRAFRGHLLVTKCLNQMIVSEVLDDHPNLGSLVDKAEDIYESSVNGVSPRAPKNHSHRLTTFVHNGCCCLLWKKEVIDTVFQSSITLHQLVKDRFLTHTKDS